MSNSSDLSSSFSLDLSLYFLLNLPYDGDCIQLVESVIQGGVTVIQLRGKDSSGRELYDTAERILPVLRKYNVGLVINDRVDVALAVGADGVHVGRDDLPVDVVKQIAPSLCVGATCYGDLLRAKKMAEKGADYLAFGAFFASPTKPEAPQIPLSVLEEARAFGLPLVAIGGIRPEFVASLRSSGADGVAVISAIQESEDPRLAALMFSEAWAKHRQA